VARRKPKPQTPGWLWLLAGFGLGLAVAFPLYLHDGGPAPPPVAREAPPPAAEPPAEPTAEARGAAPESRFDFYEMLPKFEVVIPEVESDARLDRAAAAVEEPGLYVLQVGSFNTLADADRRQAELALLGIESHVQRVTVDDAVYHRVRIGPLSDLGELNGIRRRLRDARLESLLMRVPQ
jgi:cell division protein FtsN